MRRLRVTIALTIPALVFLSCSGTRGTIQDAEEAGSRGDYDRAHAIYAGILSSGEVDALTRQRAEVARARARDAHLDLALKHLAGAEFGAAKSEVAIAGRISPKDPAVTAAAELIASREAYHGELVGRARRLLESGRSAEAASAIAELARAFPAADLTEMNASAKQVLYRDRAAKEEAERRRVVAAALAEASAAWKRGEAGAAVEALERGRARAGDAPELLDGAASIRTGTASALLSRADAELAAGRAATALLFARAALRADPGSARARGVEREAAGRMDKNLSLTVRLSLFTDKTRGRADPVTFARRVLARTGIPFTNVETRAATADYDVGGSIEAVDVATPPPQVETRTHEFAAASNWELNPEYERARDRLDDLRTASDDAQSIWRAVSDERDELERLRGSAATVRNNRRYYGAYDEALFLNLLSDARIRETFARRERDRAAKELDRAEDRLDGIPYYLERKVTGRASYRERVQTRTAEASATVEVRPTGAGAAAPRTVSVSAGRSVSDRGADAIPAAGIAFDPIDLPTDAEMSEGVLEDLAGKVAEAIAVEVARGRLGLVAEARRLEAAGRAEEALDRHAAFLLATEGRLPLERASSARRIRDAFGIDLTGESMDLSRLRLD